MKIAEIEIDEKLKFVELRFAIEKFISNLNTWRKIGTGNVDSQN